MLVHGWTPVVALTLFVSGCVVAGPIGEPEESTSTSGADDAGTAATAQSDDGQSSMTGQVTGVTATTTTASTSADSGFTTTANPTDASDDDPTGDDDSAEDTGTTGSPKEQCGVEIPAGGGNFEIGCSCDTCELYWTDIDWATYEVIAAACECLCEATGCGNHVSGEAAASGGDEEEGSASDSTASTGTESTSGG
jgi:hypothetical protein